MEHGQPPIGDAPSGLRNRRFLLGLVLTLVAVSLWIAWPYRAAVVLAVVLGYVLRPVYLKLLKAFRYRWIAASLVLLAVSVALIAPLAYLAWSLLDDIGVMQSLLSDNGYRARAIDLLTDMGLPAATARDILQDAIRAATTFIQGLLLDVLASALDLVLGLVVFFILLFYVLVDGERLVSWFHGIVPLEAPRRRLLLEQAGGRTRAILVGTFFVYALQGVVGGIGWWIFGFPAPVFWGFVMTVLAILPFMGPQLVTIPAGILALTQGNTFAGAGILIWTFVAVALIDDLVRPYVIGKQAGVHPALILVGTLGGLKVFGLSGIILGPLLLGLLEPVLQAWRQASQPPAAGAAAIPPPDDEGAGGGARRAKRARGA